MAKFRNDYRHHETKNIIKATLAPNLEPKRLDSGVAFESEADIGNERNHFPRTERVEMIPDCLNSMKNAYCVHFRLNSLARVVSCEAVILRLKAI